MKTAKVELSCHMNIDLQYGTEIGNEVWKKIILFKVQQKTFILPKIAFWKNLYFQKSLLGGLLTLKVPIMTAADDIHKYFFIVFQRK